MSYNKNTDLCVDIKTVLQKDAVMKIGRNYRGVLIRDDDSHYTFTEALPSTRGKRNPHVFEGECITVTRRDDGSYRLNFRPKLISGSVEAYAFAVANEIVKALKCLIENE